jgi:hypothetical protein
MVKKEVNHGIPRSITEMEWIRLYFMFLDPGEIGFAFHWAGRINRINRIYKIDLLIVS